MAETKDSVADAASAAAPVDKPNLWSTLLRESSKKAQIPDTTLIICGNAQVGKKELISKLAGHPMKSRDVEINDIVSFTFFDLEEGFSENISRINVWSFGESTALFEKAGDIMLHRSSPADRFAVIVAVDLSRPDECLMSLVTWLSRVAQFIKHYHEKLDPEVSKKIKHDLIKYLQHVRETKGMEGSGDDGADAVDGMDGDDAATGAVGSDADEEDIDAAASTEVITTLTKEIIETISESFGLPIVVVATKSDSILPDDGPSLKRARDIQVQMRSICLDIGAALCFTSAATDANCQVLKKYITHRLCPDHVTMELAIEDKVEVTFYPAGFDTEEMIMISSGQKGLFGTDNVFKAKLRHFLEKPQDARRKIGDANDSSSAIMSGDDALAATTESIDLGIVIEPEQEWLSRLHEFINKVSASGGAPVKVEETNLVAQPTSPMNDGGRDGKILGPKKPAVRPTPASGEKKNVGDFFKNLLESGPAKK